MRLKRRIEVFGIRFPKLEIVLTFAIMKAEPGRHPYAQFSGLPASNLLDRLAFCVS